MRLLVAGDAIPPDAMARVGQAPARQWPGSRWKLRAYAQTLKSGKTAGRPSYRGFNRRLKEFFCLIADISPIRDGSAGPSAITGSTKGMTPVHKMSSKCSQK